MHSRQKKKELAALSAKLPVPDQALKDHSDVRLAIKDLAEKRMRGEKDLKEKIARLLDAQQETVINLGKELKGVEAKAAELKGIFEEAARKKGQDQATELAKLQKELEDARSEAAEKEKSLEAAAAKLAPAVVATAVHAEGITMVPTVAGHILHSNNVCPETLHNVAMASELLAGIKPDSAC